MNSVGIWLLAVLALADGQEVVDDVPSTCYGAGSIATSVILSILLTVLVCFVLYFLWKKYRKRTDHLILETDVEKGKDEYAFDNPGFKDASITPIAKTLEKSVPIIESNKTKWNQWSPLSAITTKTKRKTLDDSAIEPNEVKVVSLRSHDFTGLGFNICGNMKDGIYIKDVLHRGPASESGKLNAGDRINSVTISFEHIVYEDALTILSYASPYEVMIEARSGKVTHHNHGQAAQPTHPVYRSTSLTDLLQGEKSSRKKLFINEDHTSGSLSSNYSSLQKSKSNMTTLERQESDSPTSKPKRMKNNLISEQLKTQLEKKILPDHQENMRNKIDKVIENEVQKTENKYQKFGIKVLPPNEKLPKEPNEINDNLENGIDEVDNNSPPPVKKREKKSEENHQEAFTRDVVLNGSGIKRDQNGIPQEIPNYMMNAAVAARTNRRSSSREAEENDPKAPRKSKGKAPAPPELAKSNSDLDEIRCVSDEVEDQPKSFVEEKEDFTLVELRQNKDYNSDSDMETDNQSSVNTIELNSSDITIHHTDEEEKQNRKTASTGDLSKIQKGNKSGTSTLERAQSLDITDTGMPQIGKKRKIEDSFNTKSDEDLFGKTMLNKEPRLSLILDGLSTFQKNRLKKSTEWGNLEDAILNLNLDDDSMVSEDDDRKFDAVVSKIEEIKRESFDEHNEVKPERKVKNQIWPSFLDGPTEDPKYPQNNEEKSNISINLDLEPKSIEIKEEIPKFLDNPSYELNSIEIKEEIPRFLDTPTQEEPQSITINEEKSVFLNSPIQDESTEIKEEIASYSSNSSQEPQPVETKEEIKVEDEQENIALLKEATGDFLFSERMACETEDFPVETNVSDDMKVSRHSRENVSSITVEPLTYVTEIQVSRNGDGHVSAIEIVPDDGFDAYVRRFETAPPPVPPPPADIREIEEIVEEQLKKLPEMRFTTSSYEATKPAPQRASHVEALRSTFEKASPKSKSRIPIATSVKTPPTSPERRNSDGDRSVFELVSSGAQKLKSTMTSPGKNVTVTAIRTGSRIPYGRPPVPPRRHDSASENGVDNGFKQWVFEQGDGPVVTNIVVSEGKQ